MMTNASVQALITEFGDRICMLIFDNGPRVFIGYPSSAAKSVNDLKFETFGGTDYIGVPKETNRPNERRKGVKFTIWHRTETLFSVITVDEGFDKYRLDPLDIG